MIPVPASKWIQAFNDLTEKAKMQPSPPATTEAQRRAQAWLKTRLERGKTERFMETYIKVGPELAAELLKLNTKNRPLQPATEAMLAEAQLEGRWRTTHQGMAVTMAGRLMDGQHRCMALIESGAIITTHIEFGAEDEDMEVVDVHKNRTAPDMVHLAGFSNATARVAVARLQNLLETREVRAIDPQKARMIAERMSGPLMEESLEQGRFLYRVTFHGITLTGAIMGYYCIRRDTTKQAQLKTFWEALCSGEDGCVGVVLKLRDSILAKKISSARNTREKATKEAAAIILDWNAWILKRAHVSLEWNKAVELPKVL